MSHRPFDPSDDPLLAELGQLGVPPGGGPVASGAALLVKAAAATPAVVGLAGVKLYSILGAVLLVGFGSGALFTRVLTPQPEEPTHAPFAQDRSLVPTPPAPFPAPETQEDTSARDLVVGSLESEPTPSPMAPMQGENLGPEFPPTPARRLPSTVTTTAAPSRRTRAEPPVIRPPGGCPEPIDGVGLAHSDAPHNDDDWVPDPAPSPELGPLGSPDPESSDQAFDDPTASTAERHGARDVPSPVGTETETPEESTESRWTRHKAAARPDLHPASGHFRAGIGGGTFLHAGATAPHLGAAVGLELIAPGPPPAAALFALNLDAGLSGADRELSGVDREVGVALRPLGTIGVDGEVGVALRPPGIARIEISGLGGVRLVQRDASQGAATTVERPPEIPQEVWDALSEEERRDRGIVAEPGGATGPETSPVFGGRLGLVLGDRKRSPLAFRASLVGQALVITTSDREVVVPVIGGTIGLDITLPSPAPARR